MSKKQLRELDRANRNTSVAKTSIYRVSKNIKRSLVSFVPYDNYIDNLRFAEYCLLFLEERCPKELKKLKFDPDFDNLAFFTGKLLEVIFRFKYIVKTDAGDAFSRDDESYTLHFMERFGLDWQFYVLDLKTMMKLDNDALRIGYAYIIEDMSNRNQYQEIDPIKENYGPKTYFDGMPVEDWMQELECTRNEILNTFSRYNTLIKRHEKYLAMDIQVFLDYKPKNEHNKLIKEKILEIYNIGFGVFSAFDEDSDGWEDGAWHYSDIIMAMCDKSDELGKAYESIQDHYIQNSGVTTPCMTTIVRNKKVQDLTTRADVKKLWRLCELVNQLNFLLP